ncbi:MAG: heme ABC exporter ATP-binding protein CcmA [Chloroflexi bacterium]|nr:heme ABC exporter ATP-binding protein CcmA [Chloroflexota bacterium]
MTPAIEIKGLQKSYGPRPALRGVDLSLAFGQALAIFGPNGSGKTTLIKVLATLAQADGGTARIAGLDLQQSETALRRRIGVVTHQTYLYDDLTSYENLRFYGRLFSVPHLEARISEVAALLGLEERMHQRVRTLSHGLQKRLSIARAVLHGPQVLLLDEPEAGLDPQAQEVLARLLAEHLHGGGAALITTHNVEQGLALGSHVAILAQGRVVYRQERPAVTEAEFDETYARLTGASRQARDEAAQ